MTPLLLLALVVVVTALLWRAPLWVPLLLLALATLAAAGLASWSGLERAASPLLLIAFALGLTIPTRTAPGRFARASGRSRRRRDAATPAGDGAPSRSSGGFDGFEIPGYDVLERVGSGGMASIYRARRRSDGTIVALKVPMEPYVEDAKFIRRFHREAEVAQRLDHPNIVRTFDHGALGRQHYMAMEYVDGRSLEGLVESGDLDLELSLDVMKRVVEALGAIHAAGIVHRDVKPGNIMVTEGGLREGRPRVAAEAVKLMDFGIAGGRVMSRLTMTGARVGTPVYMSPEQARGLRIDHRSDVYSLGLVFYEMLTGRTAFKGSYEAIVHQQIFQTPPPPRQLDVSIPAPLDALVMRMIAKDPAERPTLREVREVLEDEAAWEESSPADLPARLVIAVSARQGVLRVLDPEGTLHASIGDVGGGEDDFPGAPLAIATDDEGHLYAATFEYRAGGSEAPRMIHKLAPDGRPLARFGPYGMGEGELLYPVALAVAPAGGDVYVLDGETARVQRYGRDGAPKGAFGGRGGGQGTFDDPRQIVVGPDGRIYVLDHGDRQVQRFAPDGRYETRWALRMGRDREGMRLLDGVAVDAEGALYLSDATGGRIRLVTADGRVGRSFVVEPLTGESTDGLVDLGLDDRGRLYVARRGGHLIRRFDPDGRLDATLETYAPLVQTIVDVRANGPHV